MNKYNFFICKLIIIIICSFSTPSKAQSAYRAVYQSEYKRNISSAGVVNYSCEIITDTSYYNFPINSRRVDKNKLVYGEKIKHHSMYYFSNSGQYYFGNNWRSKPYILKSTPVIDNQAWFIDTTITHFFQGYKCANAYKIKPSGDTIFVVYTPDIKYPPGLNYYKGLTGLVLETFDTERNYYEKLVSLQKGNFEIKLPENAVIKTSYK